MPWESNSFIMQEIELPVQICHCSTHLLHTDYNDPLHIREPVNFFLVQGWLAPLSPAFRMALRFRVHLFP